jgi:F0F1-type ATP synthase assembly protein I
VTEPPKGGDGPSPMRFAGLGIQLVVMMLAGLFAGQWADRKFGTGSILTVVGAFVGFGATMWSLLRQVGQDGRDGPGLHRGDRGDK